MLVSFGCVDTRTLVSDSSPRPATASVDVFKDNEQPTRPAKQIAEMTWKGPASEELRAQASLIRKAQKLGANAIVFWKELGGAQSGFGGGNTDKTYIFKAKVLVYE